MNKDTIISVLIRTLNEKRDGLILINGVWGVGKTYFLQKEFRKYYSHGNHFYLSALGLNSLQDFKERMLRVIYLDNNTEITSLKELTSTVASVLTQKESTGKFTEQIFSLFSEAMKDYVLKDLSGVLIIDDLERIPRQLRDKIATFCLQNYQNDSRLDYILVGNFSKQSNEILSHKEKIISDEIYFSINSLHEILDQKLASLNIHYRKTITSIISELEESNLRIINRIISKIMPFFENSDFENEISDVDIKNLTSSICAHIILKEKFLYKENDFHDNYVSSSLKTLTTTSENDNNDKISEKELNLLNITAYSSYNNLMVPYCFNIISQKDLLPYVFTIRKPLHKNEYAALLLPERYDIPENDYIDEIKKVILKTNSPKLSTWLKATKNYIRLSNSKYIPHIAGLNNKNIEKAKASFSDHDIKLYFQETIPDIDGIPLHALTREKDELYNFFLKRYSEIIQNERVEKLKSKMIKHGWISIDMDIYQSQFKYKLLETLDVNLIIRAIKNIWPIHDIQMFTSHLSSLYNFSNLSDYLSDELPHLKKLYTSLNSYQKRIPCSFRRGAIFELTACVKNVKQSLEKSISLKSNTH
jgi:hypothetical protein